MVTNAISIWIMCVCSTHVLVVNFDAVFASVHTHIAPNSRPLKPELFRLFDGFPYIRPLFLTRTGWCWPLDSSIPKLRECLMMLAFICSVMYISYFPSHATSIGHWSEIWSKRRTHHVKWQTPRIAVDFYNSLIHEQITWAAGSIRPRWSF